MRWLGSLGARLQENRCRRVLANIFYGPPPLEMRTKDVKKELKFLGVHVREEADWARLSHKATNRTDQIGGWADPLDGQNLERVRGFLKQIEPDVAFLKEMGVPTSRAPRHA